MAKFHMCQELFDLIMPIGYIYTSMNSTDPKTLFGYGTWTQITNRFLYCTTSSKTTGGSTTTTSSGSATSGAWSGTSGSTTLTVNQIPSHDHGNGIDMGSAFDPSKSGGSTAYVYHNTTTSKTGKTGGGKGHTHSIPSHTHSIPNHTHTQNLPPYITCYAWYRTA